MWLATMNVKINLADNLDKPINASPSSMKFTKLGTKTIFRKCSYNLNTELNKIPFIYEFIHDQNTRCLLIKIVNFIQILFSEEQCYTQLSTCCVKILQHSYMLHRHTVLLIIPLHKISGGPTVRSSTHCMLHYVNGFKRIQMSRKRYLSENINNFN